MRHRIVAGNWKMNNNAAQTEDLLNDLIDKLPDDVAAEIIVCPSFVNLSHAVQHLEFTNIAVAAQNMHEADSGAFTGEVSADMLKSIGVETVILGHSERRAYFGETDQSLSKKTSTAIRNGMRIIFCVGEELSERQNGIFEQVVQRQIQNGLFHLPADVWPQIVIAYEPVWAIGTGETATPQQAEEMHAFIRKTISEKYGDALAQDVSILYGGSVKADNAGEIFSKPNVDGGLIGGASLKAEDFARIAAAFSGQTES